MKSDFVRQALIHWSPIVAAFKWLSVSAAPIFDHTHAGKLSNGFSVYWRVASRAPGLGYMQAGRYLFPCSPTMQFTAKKSRNGPDEQRYALSPGAALDLWPKII